jgi:hypothetical protein
MPSTGSNFSVQAADAAEGRADIVVGLTSHNDVATITAVMRAAREAVASAFGEGAARFVLADAGSTDGTAQAAREVAGGSPLVELEYERGPALAALPYHGRPDRAAALRAILQAAQQLEARACAVIDAGMPSLRPDWVERLIAPVLTDGFDYVSPCYVRHASEGALTKAIVYPMFRALYGVRLRQPAAGEFGCSARLAGHYLEQDLWDVEQAPIGIDLWLAVAAACGDFRSCEVIGATRPAGPRGGPADLSTTLAQVVGALFADLEHRVDVWQRVRASAAIPVFGTAPALDTAAPMLNVDALTESFRLGYRELREIWTWVLPPRTIVELRRLTEAPPERLRFDDRLWAGIIYDFAAGYALRVMPHDHLLRSLTPLNSGWLASFVAQAAGLGDDQVEARVEQLCLAFEAEKRHLISRWRWPERLR